MTDYLTKLSLYIFVHAVYIGIFLLARESYEGKYFYKVLATSFFLLVIHADGVGCGLGVYRVFA